MSKIPARHGADQARAQQATAPLLWLIQDRQSAPANEHDWQQLGRSLQQGDPLADAVALWIQQQPSKTGWHTFEQGLTQGANTVADIPVLFTFFKHCETTPTWLDHEALQRASNVCARSGKTGMRVLRDFGLMAGYQASAINQTLVKTGALNKGAQRRVAETTQWWMSCIAPNGMAAQQPGYRTTLKVRVIHALVRNGLEQQPDWDFGYLGRPINQVDMQVTYLAFSVMFLLGQRLLGVPVSKQEGDDVMHLWRYIGWLMGVDQRLLVRSEQEGRIALYRNLLSQPMADDSSRQLAQALMDEPLQRHYPSAQWLRSHWDKYVHLSIIRFFIGRQSMRELGLPSRTLPWYPLLFTPCNYLAQSTIRCLPGGKGWLTQRGRNAQEGMLRILFGEQTPEIIDVHD